jgi:hypothetical protein
MEPAAQEHLQLRLAAEAALPTLARLREEQQRLVPRLRDIELSIQLLQGVIEAWERIDRRNDPLVVQLQRIDQALHAVAGAKFAPAGQIYAGVERRLSPRPALVARPLFASPPQTNAAGVPAGLPIRGTVLARARLMLQTGRDRLANTV